MYVYIIKYPIYSTLDTTSLSIKYLTPIICYLYYICNEIHTNNTAAAITYNNNDWISLHFTIHFKSVHITPKWSFNAL